MKNLKHAVMLPLMGRQADRFHEYQPERPLAERLAMAARVQGAEGIEVVYPGDFAEAGAVNAIKGSRLTVAAVNLNVKSAGKWQTGSFTATDPRLRAEAVTDLKTAMDLAADLGTSLVTCCPLIDGHNYCFEADYPRQWGWLEEGIAEAARYRPEIRLGLEYKRNESRNHVILGDLGRTLHLCERLGLPNVGVTLDVGHALIAGETPAEMICLAHRAGRLFYVHFNDNGREWDWDMLPGSVNLWELIESLYYLERLDWHGWAAYDVLTRDADPVETMDATIAVMEDAERLLGKIGSDRIRQCIETGVPAQTFQHLWRSLL